MAFLSRENNKDNNRTKEKDAKITEKQAVAET